MNASLRRRRVNYHIHFGILSNQAHVRTFMRLKCNVVKNLIGGNWWFRTLEAPLVWVWVWVIVLLGAIHSLSPGARFFKHPGHELISS